MFKLSLCQIKIDLFIFRAFRQLTKLSSNSLSFIEYVLNTDLVILRDGAKKWLIKFNPLKTVTVVMVNSNIHNYYGIELKYNGIILRIFDNHKPLGVTSLSNNKWSKHIDSTTNSAYKQISQKTNGSTS